MVYLLAHFATTGGKLKVRLGNWLQPTHCIWKWYYQQDNAKLQRIEGDKVFIYNISRGLRLTRATKRYKLVSNKPIATGFIKGAPTSVSGLTVQLVTKLSEEPTLAKETEKEMDCWEFLCSWRGEWMWEGVEPGNDSPWDMSWIADGLTLGSLIWVTNGSYNRKRVSDLSGVGWIIFCKSTGFCITGSFWEKSILATSYRAELLGLCALNFLAQAVAEFYKLDGWTATLCCDNKGALEKSSNNRSRIRPSVKCADICCSLRTTKPLLRGSFRYVHVYKHMDRLLTWKLTLTQQLNCICDTLAKKSITLALMLGYHDRMTQLLPNKDMVMLIWGNKITGNISSSICIHASKELARKYLTTRRKKKWSQVQFDSVDWEHLDLALNSKEDMCRIWRSKQNSGFCGRRVQVGRYSRESLPDKRCPNCSRKETAAHLMLCPVESRTCLLANTVEDMSTWMLKDNINRSRDSVLDH